MPNEGQAQRRPCAADPSVLDHATRLVHRVCCLAGTTDFIDEIRADNRAIRSAINQHDTPTLFDWLMIELSYQGVSDRVVSGYTDQHGRASWHEIESTLAHKPTCPKLQSYWNFHGCHYHKTSTQLETISPAFAVVDMRLEDGNGLDVISALKRRRADARAIILTGYGNIATAVNAVKLGAVDYLSKPVDAEDVVAALLALEGRKAEPPENPMSADRVRWEHIQRIYELCGRNVSETARRLNMHRRTLQRILAKRAPK